MGLDEFKGHFADLAAEASALEQIGISDLRRDNDTELTLVFCDSKLEGPLEIRILVPDIERYPHNCSFFAYTNAMNVERTVADALDDIPHVADGKSLREMLEIISRNLRAALDPSPDTPEDIDLESLDDDFVNDDEYYDFLDETISPPQKLDQERPSPHIRPEFGPRAVGELAKDLQAARELGFSVGILNPGGFDADSIFSLSLRIARLGLPEDQLDAWGLKPTEYAVLLLRFPQKYPTLPEYLNSESRKGMIQLRFGKCSEGQPSYKSAALAFRGPQKHWQIDSESPEAGEEDPNMWKSTFAPIHVLTTIDDLLNNKLSEILSVSRSTGCTWDEGQNFVFQRDRATGSEDVRLAAEHPEAKVAKGFEPFISKVIPRPMQRDVSLDRDEDFNIPVFAMQFALHRLARCSKYCVVCHRRVQRGYEPVKPFVCSNNLCLYQYLSLGLGPSLELEIINNPYVVDLLISFFHHAIHDSKARQMPQGLNLKHVSLGTWTHPGKHVKGRISFKAKTIQFGLGDYETTCSLKAGQWVVVAVEQQSGSEHPGPWGRIEGHVCRLTSVRPDVCQFEIISRITKEAEGVIEESRAYLDRVEAEAGSQQAMLFFYNVEVDDLDEQERRLALVSMTNKIPSVLQMRQYLLDGLNRRLSTWGRLDPSTYTLLKWIVASNTSHIVQDDVVADPAAPPDDLSGRINSKKNMGSQWMQFRFVQGSPAKEQRFHEELEKVRQIDETRHAYPTLFVWHGSKLENWHSIIRTGLALNPDRQRVGSSLNGVWFSSHFVTSKGYAGIMYESYDESGYPKSPSWVNSQLRPEAAISICEIINRREDFLSTLPHWVVGNVDWIQCRYLFARVWPTKEALDNPLGAAASGVMGQIKQDPMGTIKGNSGLPINIPLSAVSLARRKELNGTGSGGTMEEFCEASTASEMDQDSDHDEEGGLQELLELLGAESCESGASKRRRTLSDTSISRSVRASELNTPSHRSGTPENNDDVGLSPKSESETDFVPGSLDPNAIPRLPAPAWAAGTLALPRLTRDIKDMEALQSSSNLRSLGWYIDFGRLDNAFQWVAELHSFDPDLPLAQDMRARDCRSIVLELRFGPRYPITPPFVRVIRPRFQPFAMGGGGHVTMGGAICSELLTTSGWSPALGLEKVLMEVRLNLCDTDPPARLDRAGKTLGDYNLAEAIAAYKRSAAAHGWQVPEDLDSIQF